MTSAVKSSFSRKLLADEEKREDEATSYGEASSRKLLFISRELLFISRCYLELAIAKRCRLHKLIRQRFALALKDSAGRLCVVISADEATVFSRNAKTSSRWEIQSKALVQAQEKIQSQDFSRSAREAFLEEKWKIGEAEKAAAKARMTEEMEAKAAAAEAKHLEAMRSTVVATVDPAISQHRIIVIFMLKTAKGCSIVPQNLKFYLTNQTGHGSTHDQKPATFAICSKVARQLLMGSNRKRIPQGTQRHRNHSNLRRRTTEI
ncbi:phospholipid-transporting ATPase 9 [Dorcoceras hygrometricum]|uniref:Phospholipid-transporting ATPase 9 n=1 Tax=Dorcoceras hygrometricum TaxID=472368 RepID=A0A2Z7ASU9_9LAMI|nr:phospholipid-transporting ATPase 9 [Dorcoceras hygrometricum]